MKPINKILNLFFALAGVVIMAACGENDIIIDDPSQLNPDIPIIDVVEDDYYQEHLRNFSDATTSVILKEDVKFLTPYQLKHLKSFDDTKTVLVFEGDKDRLPQPGDKIIYSPYTMGEINMLAEGCMGTVRSVEPKSVTGRADMQEWEVTLSDDADESIDDFFNEIVCRDVPIVYRKIETDSGPVKREYKYTVFSHSGSLSAVYGPDAINGGLSFEGETKLMIEGRVSIDSREQYFEFAFKPTLDLSGSLGLQGTLGLNFDVTHYEICAVPVVGACIIIGPVPLYIHEDISASLYPIFQAGARLSTGVRMSVPLYDFRICMDHNRVSTYIDDVTVPDKIKDTVVFGPINDFTVEGDAGFGLRIHPSFKIWKKEIAVQGPKLYCDFHTCLHSEVSTDFRNPVDIYHTPISIIGEAGLYFNTGFSLFGWNVSLDSPLIKFTKNFKDLYLPPTYTAWLHRDNVPAGSTVLSCLPTGDLIMPVSLGYSLYRGGKPDGRTPVKEEKLIAGVTYPSWWEFLAESGSARISSTFSNLQEGETYTAIPYIGLFNDMVAFPVFGENYYTFVFGRESPELQLKSISIPSLGDAFEGGNVEFQYDTLGRLVAYHDPFMEISAKFDYDNRTILMNDGEPYAWRNIQTNSEGYITHFNDDEGSCTVKYNNGYVQSMLASDGAELNFKWDGGKLLSIFTDDHDTDHRYQSTISFSYSNNSSVQKQRQIWYWGNMYAFLFRAGLLGKYPDYLPESVTTVEKSYTSDGVETDKQTVGIKFVLDEEGYITTEHLTIMGRSFPLTYSYN